MPPRRTMPEPSSVGITRQGRKAHEWDASARDVRHGPSIHSLASFGLVEFSYLPRYEEEIPRTGFVVGHTSGAWRRRSLGQIDSRHLRRNQETQRIWEQAHKKARSRWTE